MFERLKSLYKPKTPERVQITPPSATNLAPIVVIACGAGMAFWWWSQWARSREEARLAEADVNPAEKGEGPQVSNPQIVVDSAAKDRLDESVAVMADANQAKAQTPPAAA